jgi:uncharacterized protein YqgQ
MPTRMIRTVRINSMKTESYRVSVLLGEMEKIYKEHMLFQYGTYTHCEIQLNRKSLFPNIPR